jgi:hypothetical protein
MARITVSEPVAEVPIEGPRHSHLDWAAVLGGAVLTTAIAFILTAFGSAIGLSFASPYKQFEGSDLAWFAIAAAIWLIWVQVSSFMAGGYLAGRLRRRHYDGDPEEVQLRDGSHGLVVWAVGTLIAALVAVVVGTGAAKLVSEAAPTIAAEGQTSQDPSDLSTQYVVDVLLRPAAPANAASAAAPAAPGTPAAPAAPPASGPAPAPAGGDVAATPLPASPPGAGPLPQPRAQGATDAERSEMARILVISAGRGKMAPDDRAYLTRIVSARTGLAPAAAQQRVDTTLAAVDTRAKDAAEKARKGTVISAFVTVASLLLSAAAAWWAGIMGGRDRDAGTVFRLFGRWGY